MFMMQIYILLAKEVEISTEKEAENIASTALSISPRLGGVGCKPALLDDLDALRSTRQG